MYNLFLLTKYEILFVVVLWTRLLAGLYSTRDSRWGWLATMKIGETLQLGGPFRHFSPPYSSIDLINLPGTRFTAYWEIGRKDTVALIHGILSRSAEICPCVWQLTYDSDNCMIKSEEYGLQMFSTSVWYLACTVIIIFWALSIGLLINQVILYPWVAVLMTRKVCYCYSNC